MRRTRCWGSACGGRAVGSSKKGLTAEQSPQCRRGSAFARIPRPEARPYHGRMSAPHDVLAFWFDPAIEPDWWRRSDAFDARIAERFGALHAAATRCELWTWRASPEGRLA